MSCSSENKRFDLSSIITVLPSFVSTTRSIIIWHGRGISTPFIFNQAENLYSEHITFFISDLYLVISDIKFLNRTETIFVAESLHSSILGVVFCIFQRSAGISSIYSKAFFSRSIMSLSILLIKQEKYISSDEW